MKRESMIPHHPVLVVGHLKDIGAQPSSAENQLWGVKRNQKPKPPPIVHSEVFPVVEMILSDNPLACRHKFVGSPQLLDDLKQVRGAVHNKAYILLRQRLIEDDPLPCHGTAETSGQRREADHREKISLQSARHHEERRRTYQSNGQNWNSRGDLRLPATTSSTTPALLKMTNTSSLLMLVREKNRTYPDFTS